MTVKGKISQILPLQEGESHRGKWQKQPFVITTGNEASSYNNNICFILWGDKVSEIKLSLESEVEVHYNLSSREYNGCLLYTSPSPRDQRGSRMPSSA